MKAVKYLNRTCEQGSPRGMSDFLIHTHTKIQKNAKNATKKTNK